MNHTSRPQVWSEPNPDFRRRRLQLDTVNCSAELKEDEAEGDEPDMEEGVWALLSQSPYSELYLAVRAITPLLVFLLLVFKFALKESLPRASFGSVATTTDGATWELTAPAVHIGYRWIDLCVCAGRRARAWCTGVIIAATTLRHGGRILTAPHARCR